MSLMISSMFQLLCDAFDVPRSCCNIAVSYQQNEEDRKRGQETKWRIHGELRPVLQQENISVLSLPWKLR